MTLRMFSILLIVVAAVALHAAPVSRKGLIDINSATVEQLKTLPGIRDAKAAAIVKNRPYSNKAQLISRGILSPADYRQIRSLIVARQ